MSEVTNQQIIEALTAKKEEIVKEFLNSDEIAVSVEDHWSFDHICVVLDHSIKILSTPLDAITGLTPGDFANTEGEESKSETVVDYDEVSPVIDFDPSIITPTDETITPLDTE